MTEFWHELLTRASWEKLQDLSKEHDFILIGGWAIFLWTGKHKSKDIDIIVDYAVLSELQQRYRLTKNERLKKYEIKLDEFDIDIYLPFYSKLVVPPEKLKALSVKVQGIRTLRPEALLILKQAAELERRGSVKGQKDVIDILTLLIHGNVDLNKYGRLLIEHGLEKYAKELERAIKAFDTGNVDYLEMNLKRFADWKKRFVARLKDLK